MEARLEKAWQHHLAGRLNEAEVIYKALLRDTPSHPDALHLLGEIASQRRQFELAIDLVTQAINVNPAITAYYGTLGRTYKNHGDLNEAIACYRQALTLNSKDGFVHNSLGNALLDQGRFADAIASYKNALTFQPNLADAHSNLGNALQMQGKLEEAISYYHQALELRLDSAITHFNLGTALMEQGKLDEAISCYRDAITYRPNYVEAHCNLGVALKEQKKYDEALNCYQTALTIAPQWVDALYNLGVMYGLTKQPALAKQWYRKALEVDPELVSAHVNLSGMLADDWEEAQKHRDLAYRKQCLFITRSPNAVRSVLVLQNANNGNTPSSLLLPTKANDLIECNHLIEWVIEYATLDQYLQLPHYDLIFNAIGNPDMTEPSAQPMADFLKHCTKPVLNSPEAVARTPRHLMSQLFDGMPGLVIPTVWRVEQDGEWFLNPDFQFPALARPLASHGGEGVFLVQNADELAKVPVDRSGSIYLCAYYDYRSADGYFRKYRIIFVDRKPYPYHMAISEDWMVHYETADMTASWKLLEEERFLQNPVSVLGAQGMALIEAIGQRLDLDYGGVDFSILPDGSLLLFEANATMLIHPEEDNDALKFKNPYVQKIFDAFSELLTRITTRNIQ
ncbi:MAG TPA: tetratricopeptide repeat protein [Methylophilaceae bacterium]